MNIMYVSCALIYEYESDLRSKEHYLSRSENKSLKNLGLYGSWRSFSYSSSIYLTSNFYLKLFCSQSMRIFSALLSLKSSKQCVRAPLHQLALNRTNQSLWQSTSRTQGNQGRGNPVVYCISLLCSFVKEITDHYFVKWKVTWRSLNYYEGATLHTSPPPSKIK